MLNQILFIIPFVLFVNVLFAVVLVFLLLPPVFLFPLVVGLSMPYWYPLCLLLLFVRILFLLLKKSCFMIFLWTLVSMTLFCALCTVSVYQL